MNQELIELLLNRALQQAVKLNVAITISIVDNGGHLVALKRQENCSYFGIEASRKKALTASQLRMPTHILNDVRIKFPELGRSIDLNREIELLPGGFPINVDSLIVGGLGVSGGNFEQDKAIAEYAINYSN